MNNENAICPICKKEFTGSHKEGALRLHLFQKHRAKYETEKKVKEVKENDPEAKKNVWRFLDPKNEAEKRAILKGYNEIEKHGNGNLR